MKTPRPTRKKLTAELEVSLKELAELKPGWDDEDGKVPTESILDQARTLGQEIITHSSPLPDSLRIAADPAGGVHFILFGVEGRELEMWVETDNGVFDMLAVNGKYMEEASYKISEFRKLTAWLNGKGMLPSI